MLTAGFALLLLLLRAVADQVSRASLLRALAGRLSCGQSGAAPRLELAPRLTLPAAGDCAARHEQSNPCSGRTLHCCIPSHTGTFLTATPCSAELTRLHRFHGIDPSKNKQEKRIRKWEEEQAVKKAAASEQGFAGTRWAASTLPLLQLVASSGHEHARQSARPAAVQVWQPD